jgi:hypothetical protein
MATPTESVTSTLRHFSREIADNVTAHNAALTWLSKSGSVEEFDGGTSIDEQISYDNNPNGGSFNGYDTLAMDAADVHTYASYDPKEYYKAVMISGREEALNDGRSRIFNLWKERINNAMASMANDISVDLVGDGTGNGSKALTGLQAAIPTDPTTGTYGGLSAADLTWWRSQLVDTSATITTATITAAMNLLWLRCKRGTRTPGLILCGEDFYTIFESTLTSLQRFGSEETARYGFPTLKYKTADVVSDTNVSTYRAFFLNTKGGMKWRPHKKFNMVPMDERHPVNQNAKGTYLYLMANLTTKARRDSGLLIGD